MSEARDTDLWENGAEAVQSVADSNPSASEISDDQSSELLHTRNQKPPRKPRRRIRRAYKIPLKRLKMSYNDDYRDLFNQTVNEIVKGSSADEEVVLPMSHIGVTRWSSHEKEIFFTMLSRRGRHDLSSIAAAIGTKSELEVRVYYQLLQKATAENHLYGPRRQLVRTYEMPGAFEVSQDCSAILELKADALSMLQQREEEKLERRNHNKSWLLSKHTIRLASRRQRPVMDDITEIFGALAPAEFLNLKGFLELSERVFMNSSLAEENWRSYCQELELPSILHTAFMDFHRLAISVTKRLIQSSLFFAESRIRITTSSRWQKHRIVKPPDVRAALNVLGMKHNSQSFWIEASRRCNLAVHDNVKGIKSTDKRLSYDEVERRLGRRSEVKRKGFKHFSKPNEIAATLQFPSLSLETDREQSLSDSTSCNSLDPVESSEDSGSMWLSNQDEGRSHNEKTSEVDRDLYAEAIDMRRSLQEELRLWKLLGHDPPANIDPEDIELPTCPRRERKSMEDLDDWSSWVDYAPEWERHEDPISASSFAARRCRGRTFIGGGSGVCGGIESDNETSSSIARTNHAHTYQNNEDIDDEEGAFTSSFEGENPLDATRSEISEKANS
ncbi:hypothetical protein MMC07_005089 [Pseudocyphellaria aurata]|nr:hypothetical protein [Pseudocyphellaria aurata]